MMRLCISVQLGLCSIVRVHLLHNADLNTYQNKNTHAVYISSRDLSRTTQVLFEYCNCVVCIKCCCRLVEYRFSSTNSKTHRFCSAQRVRCQIRFSLVAATAERDFNYFYRYSMRSCEGRIERVSMSGHVSPMFVSVEFARRATA